MREQTHGLWPQGPGGAEARDTVALALLRASVKGWMCVLLDGGPGRVFGDADNEALEEDLCTLKDLFVAGGDGVLTAEETAEELLRCMADGEFLVLPHKEVRTYMERKATDTDRWITGMRRLNNAFGAENAFYSRAILMCKCETINLPRQAQDKR